MDVAVVSEQWRDLAGGRWIRDSTSRAAVWVCGDLPLEARIRGLHPGFAWARVRGLTVFSCYASPNCSLDEFGRFADRLCDEVAGAPQPVVVAGDFNAESVVWGSPAT